ncbi:hypothetical protein BGX31_002436 [Mortierella sp. GBA43]|nr:hypothetical protein BGX31_002436 [Mortierella sp. GBA43]
MDKTNPLHIPEVIALVGDHIRMWYSIGHDRYGFKPHDMHSCILVSRLFRDTLTPVLWHTFDEQAMLDVPIHLIEKYMPYIRIYFNYGFRLDYPTSKRLLSTHLIWLSITPQYRYLDPLEKCDIDFIRTSSNMKRLEGVTFNRSYSGVIGNLRHLEHLQVTVHSDEDGPFLKQALWPISQTMRAIHLDGDMSILQGMVFPNLKVVNVASWFSKDQTGAFSAFPNIESLGCWEVHPEFWETLQGGAYPGVKKLCYLGSFHKDQAFLEMLENRTGFQELDIDMDQGSYQLSSVINRQAATLTHLRLEMKAFCMRTAFHILGCCGHLMDVSLGPIEREHMERVLWKAHWKNPDMLKRIELSTPRPDHNSYDDFECALSLGYHRELAKNDRFKRPTLFSGWIIPTGDLTAPDDQQFLNSLFVAAQGFTRLGTITIDGVSYSKAFN